MLVVGRGRGKEVMIGDHSVVTVVSFDNAGVKLGFETRDRVKRVDSPSEMVASAKIKARRSHAVTSRLAVIEKVPVFVAVSTTESGDAPQIKAAFAQDKASYPGAELVQVNDRTREGPAHHQFLVVRCSTPEVVEAVKIVFRNDDQGRVFLDEMEHADASLYLLFVQTIKEGVPVDVAYMDLVK